MGTGRSLLATVFMVGCAETVFPHQVCSGDANVTVVIDDTPRNLTSDPQHCGCARNVCRTLDSGANGVPICDAGTCAMECNPGFGDCNREDRGNEDGCETALDTTQNCGACGRSCALPNASVACPGGQCTITSCNAPYADCDGDPTNGCEVNTATDPRHCGTCGGSCPSTHVPTPACGGGVCIGSCETGFADCDGNRRSNGCEVSVTNDTRNCGSCGISCTVPNAMSRCVDGMCAVMTCIAGWADCDGSASNGCEINISQDVNNCGACRTFCPRTNATPTCSSGQCGLSCVSGYGNCDGSAANGCETSLSGNNGNCGRCGNVCPSNQTCQSGSCGCGTGVSAVCGTYCLYCGSSSTPHCGNHPTCCSSSSFFCDHDNSGARCWAGAVNCATITQCPDGSWRACNAGLGPNPRIDCSLPNGTSCRTG